MKSNSTAVPIILVLLLVLLCVGYQRTSASFGRLSATSEDARKLHERRITALKSRLAAADAAKAEAEVKLAKLSSPASGSQGSGQKKTIYVNIDDYPAYAALRMRLSEQPALRTYHKALAPLNLPPDELARIDALLVELMATGGDISVTLTRTGMYPWSARWLGAANDAFNQWVAPVADEIKAVMGESDYHQFVDAVDLDVASYSIGNWALQDSGVPLSADQLTALTQIRAKFVAPNQIVGTDPNYASARAMQYAPPDPQTGLKPADQATLEQAASVLSPQQLQVLRQYYIDNARQDTIQMNAMQQAEAQVNSGKP